jgi:hypothetical protein
MNEEKVLAAPLDGITEGRLVIRRGLANVVLGSDAGMAELYTVRCTGRTPRVRYSGGTVELTYPLTSLTTRGTPDMINLNGTIPWEIEVAGGVGDVRADFTNIDVRSIDVEGGVLRTSIDLSQPDGTLPVRLGAVSDVMIRRAAGVPVRVQIRRGARLTTVDAEKIVAATGPTTIVTPGFDRATNRLDISVDAADHFTVTAASAVRLASVPAGDIMLAASSWLMRLGGTGVSRPELETSTSD